MHGKNYFRVEDYIPASRIEKMTLAYVQRELAKLHRMNRSLFEDEAELEFLKVYCHTPKIIYFEAERPSLITIVCYFLLACYSGF